MILIGNSCQRPSRQRCQFAAVVSQLKFRDKDFGAFAPFMKAAKEASLHQRGR
jgi:hypothetical protein